MTAFAQIRALHADDGYAETGFDAEEAARFNRSVLRLLSVVGVMILLTFSVIAIIEAPMTIPCFLVMFITANAYFKVKREAE